MADVDLDKIHENYAVEQKKLRDKIDKKYISPEKKKRCKRRLRLLEERLIPELLERMSKNPPQRLF